MNKWLIVIAVLSLSPLFIDAHAQFEINVTESDPCFDNYNLTGIELLQDCGLDTDYMATVVYPFEWVTGGLFSMLIVVILIIMTWVKYHTPLYPLLIGVVMLPTSAYLFPDLFVSFGFILAIVSIGGIIWYIMTQRTRTT